MIILVSVSPRLCVIRQLIDIIVSTSQVDQFPPKCA